MKTKRDRRATEILQRAGTPPLAGGLEIRDSAPAGGGVQLRAEGDDADDTGWTLEGVGIVYGSWTEIGRLPWGFRERIAAGAGKKTIDEGDARSCFNHDVNYLLGRVSAGTLRLAEDDDGVTYTVDLVEDDPHHQSVRSKVARGDVTGSSFWFRVLREEWTFTDDPDEWDERTILEYELFETGPVVFPAYETTTAGMRSLGAAIRSVGVQALDEVLRGIGVDDDSRRDEAVRKALARPEAFAEELARLLRGVTVPTPQPPPADDVPGPVALRAQIEREHELLAARLTD